MRIALNAWFLNQPGTGSGQYLRQLLPGLLDQAPEHRFLLVYPGSCPDEQFATAQIQVRALRGRFWRNNLGKVAFEQIAFPWVCRQWGADLAHVPYWGSSLLPSLPTLVTIHDIIPLLLPPYRGGPLVRLYTRLVAASARRAAGILTDSLASKADIERHLSIQSSHVRHIYLAAAPHFGPKPDPADSSVRDLYGLPDRYVLYLAGHDVRKNVASLLEAFVKVAQADADVALVIGGRLPEQNRRRSPLHKGSLFFDPRPVIAELGLQSVVSCTGWVEEAHKPALYRGADCAVFASRYEGFGLPVLEALACGTPLVASSASSLPELIGDAGFAVDPDDVKGLAGAILACLVDETLAQELRQRGPAQAARFSWTKTARETLMAYQAVSKGWPVGQGATCAS